MKHILLFLIVLATSFLLSAQNIQFHYDFRKHANDKAADGRDYLRSRLEMFKPDSMGSTYWFADMFYNGKDMDMNTAYFEIYRDQRIFKLPVQLHLEYNGGLYFNPRDTFASGTIANALLFGLAYPFTIGAGSYEFQGMYKYFRAADKPDFQFTFIWSYNIYNGRFSLCGYADFWSEPKFNGSGKKLVFLTGPQFWYNINNNISVGGEIEISRNFVYLSNKWEEFPTIAAKWCF